MRQWKAAKSDSKCETDLAVDSPLPSTALLQQRSNCVLHWQWVDSRVFFALHHISRPIKSANSIEMTPLHTSSVFCEFKDVWVTMAHLYLRGKLVSLYSFLLLVSVISDSDNPVARACRGKKVFCEFKVNPFEPSFCCIDDIKEKEFWKKKEMRIYSSGAACR